MASLSHQPKLSRKRALDAMAPRQKRAKGYIESINDEADANAAAPITSICNELIDRIFDFLDGKSLLNVAGTCKRLQVAATAKFGQKFGKKLAMLHPKTSPPTICEYEGVVAVYGLKYVLPFLRCFGSKTTSLKLSRDQPTASKKEMHLYRYVQQYCADTVTKLHFEIEYRVGAMFPVELFSNSKPFQS